ncbi:MAG: head decoration protein [Deltaproteobacteria bacterium]|nr:head decoration protein [Deltaproteobacteria bacterium]
MTTEYTKDNKAYIAGNYTPLTKTIGAGANEIKGTIMGRQTVDGKLYAYNSANIDGTENPVCILGEDAAAAAADVKAENWFAGVYVEANMTGLDAAGKLALEARGIYFV